mmetsp:Transcript_3503/g.4661  ORF Transcript_3503/g.4661 Transcript_3503/m.4661 type:complete len:83 (+) Transcript_3503:158-406(+)
MGILYHSMYSDVPDYHNLFNRVKEDMAANHKVIEKNKKILHNLKTQMDDVDMDYHIFTDLSKAREVKRKKYDHYKVKLAKLR